MRRSVLTRCRSTTIFAPLLVIAYLLIFHVCPVVYYHAFPERQMDLPTLARRPQNFSSDTSVDLVIATRAKDDITWTSRLELPNLNIIRYVSDDASAAYHPPIPKGREALMYFTYLHDHYDSLPDLSIFIHYHEHEWHVDGALRQSMTFLLTQLDLEQVRRRGYFNLRVSWKDACPAWINTTKSFEESTKREEPWMAAAFNANFGSEVPVPETFAGPCCSQFAVTREAIRSRPRSQYKRSMDWLTETSWDDYLSGRVWEHMWPYLFLNSTSDCAVEWKSLCRMFGVCFEHEAEELEWYNLMWDERHTLEEATEFWNDLLYPHAARRARARIAAITILLEESLQNALEHGKQAERRGHALGDMYSF